MTMTAKQLAERLEPWLAKMKLKHKQEIERNENCPLCRIKELLVEAKRVQP